MSTINTYPAGYAPIRRTFQTQRNAKDYAKFLKDKLKDHYHILDCGCGPGSITLGLAEWVSTGKVVGIDREDSEIAYANNSANGNVSFKRQNIFNMSFADNSFDVVHSHAVLDYFRNEQIKPVLQEMLRVCRPGGFIAVRLPNWDKLSFSPPNDKIELFHKRFFDRIKNKCELTEGFREPKFYVDILNDLKVNNIIQPEPSTYEHKGTELQIWASLFINTLTFDENAFGAELLSEIGEFCMWANGPDAMITETWDEILAWKA